MGFSLKDILHDKAWQLLRLETDPGLGCTEPAAIGLCAAVAASLLQSRDPDTIVVETDPNIYKNAMGVSIPNAASEAGIPLAAALGAVAGEPVHKLQIFSTVGPEALEKARDLVRRGRVTAGISPETGGLFVKVTITAGEHAATVVVSGRHDHVSSRILDGRELGCDGELGPAASDSGLVALEEWLLGMGVADLVSLVDEMDAADLDYVREGLALNEALVEYGLAHGPGIAVGRTQLGLIRQGLLKKDMAVWAGVRTAAGIDSRMGGVPLPAMTLAGSGNQCIAAGIPVVTAAQYASMEDQNLPVRAVMLSYLITCSIKAGVGRLSALCGSGMAGGAGVAAATAYLFGGTVEKIGGAVKNHIAAFCPVACDGAKTGCALKVGEMAAAAVKNGLLALSGCIVRATDGVVDASAEKTMKNLGVIAKKGLANLDPVILDIMLHKQQ
ncbi:MAG: serine dehydratase subunit alpha family protein [Thermodesulfobacteriota bacterium]